MTESVYGNTVAKGCEPSTKERLDQPLMKAPPTMPTPAIAMAMGTRSAMSTSRTPMPMAPMSAGDMGQATGSCAAPGAAPPRHRRTNVSPASATHAMHDKPSPARSGSQ